MERIVKFHRATVDEAAALARVHVDSWHAAYRGLVPDSVLQRFTYEWRTERFRESLAAGSEETYVIEVDGRVAGFLTLGNCRDSDADPARTGEIWGIYLAPQYWRRGIGTRALQAGERVLRSRGYEEATLWVLEGNEQARGFYEAMGFQLDGGTKEVELGIPLKAIRYRKKLTQGGNHVDQETN